MSISPPIMANCWPSATKASGRVRMSRFVRLNDVQKNVGLRAGVDRDDGDQQQQDGDGKCAQRCDAAAAQPSCSCRSSGRSSHPVDVGGADEAVHDLALGGRGGQLLDDRAARHDVDPVAESRELGGVGGVDQDREPVVGRVGEHPVDVQPGPRVDALGGLVDDEHLRVSCSAGRASTIFCWLPPDRPLIGWYGDAETMPRSASWPARTPAAAGSESQCRPGPASGPSWSGRVVHDGHRGEDRLCRPVAALEADTGRERGCRRHPVRASCRRPRSSRRCRSMPMMPRSRAR